ncbi:thiamine/molybdopterin biosynthesis protein MoeB [Oceanobacillus oncorhynchi subsp. incaldanensis]|uniref:MoeB/ThiF family adenylyltransferase n=1 Tax=Oceanobacillus oncorhynchi TaxID=545501 RepID=UPI001B0982E3|nr:MoeB/ThiF family adenylyltransferase [Oceanobacillus oncorhynchi]GIO19548.1 thiamine/molybdopterin biosynthesis protein MoeB [Oceanobacillus oncorhynchi subsp. incaldanensis]
MRNRYSRQTLFKPIGEGGQEKIRNKHVLILGCGALGTANAENLVRAGIGKLTMIDRDYVELSNLQRQQLYTEKEVYEQIPKAIAAKQRLQEINSSVVIEAHIMDSIPVTLQPLLKNVDVIIDATDNFETRFMLNDLSNKQQIPWIYGSCVGSTGMSFTILPDETPCLGCLMDKIPASGATCDSVGIISPAVQMVVAHQTAEALKILVEDKKALRTSLLTFDLWNNHYHTMKVERAKKKSCPSCGENPSYPSLNYQFSTKSEVLCGRNTVQIRTSQEHDLHLLEERLKRIGSVKANDFLISIEYETYRLVFFQDGRTLIHGTNSIEKAKSIYYQLTG